MKTGEKNSNIIQRHVQDLLSNVSPPATQNKPLGLHGVMGAAHSSSLMFGEEIFQFSNESSSFFLFSRETKLKISGALSGGSETVEGAIPEH